MAKVSFALNPTDFRAVLLGSMGFSSVYIQRQTGLTVGQVQYRLRKAKVRLGDYRAGTNVAARQVLLVAQDQISNRLQADLEKLQQSLDAMRRKSKGRTRQVA